MTAKSWKPRGLDRRGFLRTAGPVRFAITTAGVAGERRVPTPHGLVDEVRIYQRGLAQAAELLDGTSVVRPLFTTDTSATSSDRTPGGSGEPSPAPERK